MNGLLKYLLLALLPILLSACLEENCQSEISYTHYEPIFLDSADFRVNISVTEPKPLCNPAGFYVYGDYLLVIEYNDGLHIMDNSDPSNPQSISYLPVDGAVGLSVRNNILYINNYVDLLTFDLSNPTAPQMLKRIMNVFHSYGVFNEEFGYSQVLVGYEETSRTVTLDCDDRWYGYDWFFVEGGGLNARTNFFGHSVDAATVMVNTVDNSGGPHNEFVGQGGSLARFTISNQSLYVVENSDLRAFDLTNPAEPVEAGIVSLGWGVETIFPQGDELYIGTRTGMHIMDATDPLNPRLLGTINHTRSCDPVVVSGDRAYVTLLGNGLCGGNTNQLDVIDLSDKTAPAIIESYTLNGPVGLTVGNDKLFICEPDYGLRIVNLDDNGLPILETMIVKDEYEQAKDIIGLHYDQRLITIGTDGVRQLRYNESNDLDDLSLLSVCP